MAGTQAPSGLRDGGVPPGGPDSKGNLAVPGLDVHPADSQFPSTPCKVGDALGARVVGGRGPSLNGAPVVASDGDEYIKDMGVTEESWPSDQEPNPTASARD